MSPSVGEALHDGDDIGDEGLRSTTICTGQWITVPVDPRKGEKRLFVRRMFEIGPNSKLCWTDLHLWSRPP
jgi:hypothetical protein